MKNYELQAFLQFDDGSSGNAAANQSFNVTIARGANVGNDATIYQDADGATEITRPFQTDQYGRFKFYAANGYYNILFDDPDVANLNNLLDRDIFTVEQASQTVVGLTRYSTQAEALAGTNNSSAMTPLRTKESYGQYGLGRNYLDKNNDTIVGTQFFRSTSAGNSTLPPKIFNAHTIHMERLAGAQSAQLMIEDTLAEDPVLCYRVRTSSSWGDFVQVFTDKNLAYCQNKSGATVQPNQTIAGSSLDPAFTGTFKSANNSPVLNDEYGLFLRV